ncbi:MAG: TSUP family transporter [Eggerthellaceae bacterium]|nr:TSUP family transporter [Eggerthellaceae bacterium]
MMFLIVCPLAMLAGFVDAIAGGGGFITLPAYLMAGLPPHFAIGTNKLSSTMGTAVATWHFARDGFIPWKRALACAVFALMASALGARLTVLVPEDVLSVALLLILPVTALYVFRSRALDQEREPLSPKRTLALGMARAAAVGFYDGFYGPGTGTFLILLLTGAAHVGLREANGITKVINLSSNAAALIMLLINAKVVIPLGLTAGAFNMLGNYVGARTFVKSGVKVAKPAVAVVLALFFVTELAKLFG